MERNGMVPKIGIPKFGMIPKIGMVPKIGIPKFGMVPKIGMKLVN